MSRIKIVYLRYHRYRNSEAVCWNETASFLFIQDFHLSRRFFDNERHLFFQLFDLALHFFDKTASAFRRDA